MKRRGRAGGVLGNGPNGPCTEVKARRNTAALRLELTLDPACAWVLAAEIHDLGATAGRNVSVRPARRPPRRAAGGARR